MFGVHRLVSQLLYILIIRLIFPLIKVRLWSRLIILVGPLDT